MRSGRDGKCENSVSIHPRLHTGNGALSTQFGIQRFGFRFDVPSEYRLTDRYKDEEGDGALFLSPDKDLLAAWVSVGYESRGALGISLELAADRDVSADVTSSVINRQDQPVEDHSAHDPRRAGRHAGRVLLPVRLDGGDGSLRLSWETAESKQRIGMAVDHWTYAGVPALRHPGGRGRQQRPLRPGRRRRRHRSCWRRASATPCGQASADLADDAEAGLKPLADIFAQSAAHYRDYWTTSDIVLGRPDRTPAGASAGTSSSWRRPRPAPTSPASRPRA